MHRNHINELKLYKNVANQSRMNDQIETEQPSLLYQGKNGLSYQNIKRYNLCKSFGRIVPKKITQDKELMYEDNLKLRQKVKDLEIQNLKLKTRISVAQKQKQQIISSYFGQEKSISDLRLSTNYGDRKSKSNLKKQNTAKRIIRDAKDEVQHLKMENTRLKKHIKYTQILQLKTQKEELLEQTYRLEELIQKIIQTKNQEEEGTQYAQLKKKIQQQKDQNKTISYQLKKSNEQCQKLKEKIKQLEKKQVGKEKKLNKSISQLKTEIQKQKQPDIMGVVKSSQSPQGKQCKNCSKLQAQNKKLKSQIVQLKKKQKANEKQKPKQVEEVKKDEQKFKKTEKKVQNKEEQEEKIDIPEVDSDNEKNKSESILDYQEDFGQESDVKDEVKFKKNQKEQNQFSKSEEQETKNQKIIQVDSVTKQTITYKLKAQRYTYENFEKDIKQSKISQFSFQEVATMLNNEPFYLVQDQLELVLWYCFEKKDLNTKQVLPGSIFLKKMKEIIGNIKLLPEKEQQKLIKQIGKELLTHRENLEKAFKKVEGKDQTAKKKDFEEILKGILKFSNEKIEISLAQACLLSKDIEHLNHRDFMKHFAKN